MPDENLEPLHAENIRTVYRELCTSYPVILVDETKINRDLTTTLEKS